MKNIDTKKIIVDTAVENTIYNIVSESANGLTDLTEKQRIYFFLDKSMKPIDSNLNNNNNQEEIAKNNEEKEENKNKENKEKIEEEKNE